MPNLSLSFDPLDRLREILHEGVRNELVTVIQAKSLWIELGKHASAINAQNYGGMFGRIQDFSVLAITLALTKLFDKDRKTRSLYEVVRLLRAHARHLEFRDRAYVIAILQKKYGEEVSKDTSKEDLLLKVATVIEEQIQSAIETVEKLKYRRDKIFAHSEVAIRLEDLGSVTWSDIEELLDVGIRVLELLGYPLFGLMEVTSDGTFLVGRDALMVGAATKRLMKQARINQNPSSS